LDAQPPLLTRRGIRFTDTAMAQYFGCVFAALSSKAQFKRELHDPWIQGRSDLAQGIAVAQSCSRIVETGMVQQVESLNTQIQFRVFVKLESSPQRGVDIPPRWAEDGGPAGVTVRS